MPEPPESTLAVVPAPQGGELAVLPTEGSTVAAEGPAELNRSAIVANLMSTAVNEPLLVSYYLTLTRDRTRYATPWASLQASTADTMRFHMQSIEALGRKYAARIAASMVTQATTEEQIATWDSAVVSQPALPAPPVSADADMEEAAVEDDTEDKSGDEIEIPDWDCF